MKKVSPKQIANTETNLSALNLSCETRTADYSVVFDLFDGEGLVWKTSFQQLQAETFNTLKPLLVGCVTCSHTQPGPAVFVIIQPTGTSTCTSNPVKLPVEFWVMPNARRSVFGVLACSLGWEVTLSTTTAFLGSTSTPLPVKKSVLGMTPEKQIFLFDSIPQNNSTESDSEFPFEWEKWN